MSPQRIEELLAGAVAGELTPDEAAALLEACRADPALRRRLALLASLDRLAPAALRPFAEEEFAAQVARRVACEEPASADRFTEGVSARLHRRRLARWGAVAGGLAALLTLALLSLLPGAGQPLAELTRAVGTETEMPLQGLEKGRRLELAAGVVELAYRSGVRVVLEGPADYEITGPNSGHLRRGRLVAEITDQRGQGFTVDGPSGRLVDLGTRFGVSVAENGGMEVHVLEGLVDALPKRGKTTRLAGNEALRLSSDGIGTPLPAATAEAFVTELPPLSTDAPRTVRWNFEEVVDGAVPDVGRALGEGRAAAGLRKLRAGSAGVTQVPGPHGMAVGFDGRDGWLESAFKGIEGPAPRTVAFWVRVPRDSKPTEGYGIINWGDVKGLGTAWQVSVNPIEEEGPLGRLRVGTGKGCVVGTTDLRDGQWHHCAVVLYGDPEGRPNTSTHILLYVDGRLEPAARKSVRDINTRTDPAQGAPGHGVWMGRNLAFMSGSKVGYDGRFFRGELDEMVVCDRALSQDEIRNLMRNNTMP